MVLGKENGKMAEDNPPGPDDIFRNAFGPVDGFFTKFFDGPSQGLPPRPGGTGRKWRKRKPKIILDLEWLKRPFLSRTDGCNTFYPLDVDHVIILRQKEKPSDDLGLNEWQKMHGVGYFHIPKTPWYNILERFIERRTVFEELYGYAREIFKHQPARIFLHCFYVFGGEVEPWLFDRTGAYSCQSFHVNEPKAQAMINRYLTMDSEQLGLNMCFVRGLKHEYVLFGENEDTQHVQIIGSPLKQPKGIVDTRTPLCYPVVVGSHEDGQYGVVKMKWISLGKRHEESLMQLAAQNRVEGVANLYLRDTQANMEKLHAGLRIMSAPCRWDLTLTGKPKGRTAHLRLQAMVLGPLGRPLDKYLYEDEVLLAIRDAIKAHRMLYFTGGILHRDISGGNIVISNHTDPYSGEKRFGTLIDFDHAVQVDKVPRYGPAVGTPRYLAIGLLRGEAHTYRHDLESFFYVFLWRATLGRRKRKECSDKLICRWEDDRDGGAFKKVMSMASRGTFDGIVQQFQPEFQRYASIAWAWRKALFFPTSSVQALFDARPQGSPEKLYDEMLQAVDTALGLSSTSGGSLR
jgi:serine/threonine protein kinase